MMTSSQCIVWVLAGLALVGLANSDPLDEDSVRLFHKLFQPQYQTDTELPSSDQLDTGYMRPPDLNWGLNRSPHAFLGAVVRHFPSFRKQQIEQAKRFPQFGFMASRGKRLQSNPSYLTVRDLIDSYHQKLQSGLAKLAKSSEEESLFNNKRQPHFGFHGSRG